MRTLVVIGGGAAGVFCAANAARLSPGLKVILLEKTNRLLSKVRVSGGGRCNVTHACSGIAEMARNYPRGAQFLKKSFGKFFVADTVSWFSSRGVALKTEEDGRMFPVTDSSETIIQCLVHELNAHHVDVRFHSDVKQITRSQSGFILSFDANRQLAADFVCIATGGFPKPAMFSWLTDLGHSFQSSVPSLFTFNLHGHPLTSLMGISVSNVSVKISGSNFRETGPLLITHWGFSGPAILRLSAWASRYLHEKGYDFVVVINWVHPLNEEQVRELLGKLRFSTASQRISSKSPFNLPSRLWIRLLELSGISAELRWADLPAAAQNKLIKILCNHECQVKGKTTFKEEFVTAGGITLAEIEPHTMQSKLVPGLFFAGEIMDVDGITGGYNFQHAWTSGWMAANAIAQRLAAES